MASLNMFFSTPAVMTTRRERMVLCKATSAKGGSSEEKSILDWVLGGMTKEDQLLETDPILKKVEDKDTTAPRKGTVSIPAPKKKNGGFGLGGLFAK